MTAVLATTKHTGSNTGAESVIYSLDMAAFIARMETRLRRVKILNGHQDEESSDSRYCTSKKEENSHC